MARPKPTILLEHTDNKTYRSEQVLKAVSYTHLTLPTTPYV